VGAVTGAVLSAAFYGAGQAWQAFKAWLAGKSAVGSRAAEATRQAPETICGAGNIGCAEIDVPENPEFGTIHKASSGKRYLPAPENDITYKYADAAKNYGDHGGVDIPRYLKPVPVTHDGMAAVGVNRHWGVHVLVYRQDGSASLYAHLSKVSVRTGDLVSARQIIGVTGNTGLNKSGIRVGWHLHFGELNSAGQTFDPLLY